VRGGHRERHRAHRVCFTLSSLIGPAFAVLLYRLAGCPGLMAVNGVSYLLAAGLETRCRVSRPAAIDETAAPSRPFGAFAGDPC